MSANEENRPDPDQLLKAVTQENAKALGGKLRVFFGMSAGVGKTYAMLEAARALRRDGVDVAAGLVVTHKRAETAALLEGLEVLPPKKLEYRDKIFEELDLDAVLARRPEVALIDELAHTNIPGSRHAKRWQDVLEVLDAGIDVYTTLNVQHIESRKEDVEVITGITIHETVPDSVLERASRIELVDITPADLIERLHEGRVYLGEQAGLAADNFFKTDRLTALRELSLRVTGEMVSNELKNLAAMRPGTSSALGSEKLMVAVSCSPYSAQLVRAARRAAFSKEADWIAVNVDTGEAAGDTDRKRLAENLELARKLGAEVLTTDDPDIVSALKRMAKQHGVTQIILGSPRGSWLGNVLRGGTLLDKFVKETDIDIYVMHEHELPEDKSSAAAAGSTEGVFEPDEYVRTLAGMCAVTLLGSLVAGYTGYKSVGFIYLLAVMATGLFYGLGPVLLAALLGAIGWNYFFIPPIYTFHISDPEDLIMCAVYFVTALIMGTLTQRIRSRERLLRQRESRNETMYDIVEAIALSPARDECVKRVCGKIGAALDGDCAALYRDARGDLAQLPTPFKLWFWDQKKWAVAKWAYENDQPAGWSTETLSMSATFNIPLKGPSGVSGVLAFLPHDRGHLLSLDESNLLNAAAAQIAVYLERESFRESSIEAKKFEESERLHQTILSSISHEIKTPLTAIMGLSSALETKDVGGNPELRGQLLGELGVEVVRLNREINNILDMSRLSSGVLTLKKEWTDMSEVANACAVKLKKELARHPLAIKIPDGLPFLKLDFALFESALTNLLLNAVNYTPERSSIEISAEVSGGEYLLRVSDNGPGLPEEQLSSVFEKFYRVPGSRVGGTGLGLSIAKSVVEAHGGKIAAKNRSGGGLEITVALPLERQPELKAEQ